MPVSSSGDAAGGAATGGGIVGRRIESSVLAVPLVAEFLPNLGTATAVVDGLKMRDVDILGVVRLRPESGVTRIHTELCVGSR